MEPPVSTADYFNALPADPVTGLMAHSRFMVMLEEQIVQAKQRRDFITVMLINIDFFTLFNAHHGFERGDGVLRQTAVILKEVLRGNDFVARYGGGSFAVILGRTEGGTAESIARRIQSTLNSRVDTHPTVSIGIAVVPPEIENAIDFIRRAEEALAAAKRRGKNGIGYLALPCENSTENSEVVLVVDDDQQNLKTVEGYLVRNGYTVVAVDSGEEALSMVGKCEVDLVLLDVMMPCLDGYEVCRRIKGSESTRHIPVILLTALDDQKSRLKGIDSGADDFLTKPVDWAELLARTRSLIKVRNLNKNYANIEAVLMTLAGAVDARDSHTSKHTERVATLAMKLGEKMDLPEADIRALRLGGILHDIGKIGVPGRILKKTAPLNEEETKAMQRHTELGYEICLPLRKSLGKALDIIRHHHERLDGSSYPDGLKGNQISMVARIMAVVDVYDALISDRPYRHAVSENMAIKELRREAEEGKLDSTVVETLAEVTGVTGVDGKRAADPNGSCMKVILTVDGNPLNSIYLRRMLKSRLYRLEEAFDGISGVQRALELRPDLILIDVCLPDMNGFDAVRMMRADESLTDIPIIAVNSHGSGSDKAAALDAGCSRYIHDHREMENLPLTIDGILTG